MEGDWSGDQDIPPQDQGHVSPQVREQVPPQVPNGPSIGNAILEEFKASMTFLAQHLIDQANRGEVAEANTMGGTGVTRVRKLLRMNPPEFYGSKVDEDLNGFIDEVYKVLAIMGVSSIEKAELASYQLTDVAQLLYE
ncbi:hypothetical protein EJD97_017099 [Solanum chilense]|uniref:Gag-pol polyprotein n=1 Tax=Solanum chilense TaxID=4083 RepID=A0A6N2CEY4_SOLCI|nr:hypothetical protein EJD97_017099 [Solanum chilense]